jgi:hypothetical protein
MITPSVHKSCNLPHLAYTYTVSNEPEAYLSSNECVERFEQFIIWCTEVYQFIYSSRIYRFTKDLFIHWSRGIYQKMSFQQKA